MYAYISIYTRLLGSGALGFLGLFGTPLWVHWVLGSGYWVLGTGYWVLGTGCWVLGSGYWVLGSGYWVLGTGCWVLGTGYWVLGIGFWVLGSGYWVLGSGYWVSSKGGGFAPTFTSSIYIYNKHSMCIAHMYLYICLAEFSNYAELCTFKYAWSTAEEERRIGMSGPLIIR